MFVTRKSLIAVAALAVVGLSAGSASAQFGPRQGDRGSRHQVVDRLAVQLERDTRTLKREADEHFRRAPDYRNFDLRVTQIARLADHIHDLAHQRGNFRHMRNDVVQIDRLFHEAERQFNAMVIWGRLDRKSVRHLRGALSQVERDIHTLRAELK
jgi:hypothetical protein